MLKANGKSSALQNNRIFPVTNYTALTEQANLTAFCCLCRKESDLHLKGQGAWQPQMMKSLCWLLATAGEKILPALGT